MKIYLITTFPHMFVILFVKEKEREKKSTIDFLYN